MTARLTSSVLTSAPPSGDAFSRPLIFIGPSIGREVALSTLPHAEYRRPIRRGDLDDVPAGRLVGIIDGVFAQELAISPREIREAINRGVVVYGAASMGALRAAEIPQMIGVGRIFDLYRSGALERDDEVAVLFDPDTDVAVTVPLVNVRYAVDRLTRSATLSREAGEALTTAAGQLHYTERTYPNILRNSALADNRDADDIIHLLSTFDLKRDDAQFLLETLAEVRPQPEAALGERSAAPREDRTPTQTRVRAREQSSAPLLVWESGDVVEFDDLVRFLKITGAFEEHARATLTRMKLAGKPAPIARTERRRLTAQGLLDLTRLQWGWESPEEAHVTMRDLGLGLDDVAEVLECESVALREVRAAAQHPTDDFAKGLRTALWYDQLALKREVLRLGALHYFAAIGSGSGSPTEAETVEARRCIARLRGVMQWSYAVADLQDLGLEPAHIEHAVRLLAWARRAAPRLRDPQLTRRTETTPTRRAPAWRSLGLNFQPSQKAGNSRRFTMAENEAATLSARIAQQMGIVRIGLVGELSTLGVHVAQAFGERSGWSSTFSSGKAETRDGARTGSIMEEAELHAQDAYLPSNHIRISYAKATRSLPVIDPETLALPFDSRYEPTAELDWSECIDLVNEQSVLVPTSCLTGERVPYDIYYSPRLGGKIFSSSGLGSGFTLAEATVHAVAEVIERHAQRLAEIELDNPGGVGVRSFWFIDEETLPETPRRIVGKYHHGGMTVRILDMTSDIAVPTFYVRVFDDPFLGGASTSSDGFACHPDPEVAITMALLEAAQTQAGFIAGGREDFSLQARSLGRHERPRTALPKSQVFWFSNDPAIRPFDPTQGYQTPDVLEELEWMVDRVAEAGYPHVCVADLTMPRIAPAHAVRVLIPNTEATNPLCTGPAARATCIRDLLPHSVPVPTEGRR